MVASIHQLSRLVNALLAQEMSNAPTPQAAPAPNGLSFLTDPKFLAALSTTTAPGSAPSVPVGRQSSTALPAKTQALQRSVSNIGYQPHHQSIFGKVFDLMSRPMFAVGEAARQGLESDVQGKGIGDLLKSVGSGAIQGFEGKQKTDWTRILDEAGQLHHEGLQGKTIQQAVRDVNAGKAIKSDIGGKTAALGGLIGDIAFDPLTYVGIGAATKVKDVGHTAEEFAKAKDVQKTLQEAGHSDTNAIPKLLLGDLKEGKYYRKGALPNSAQRAETMQRVAGIAEKYGDASWEKFIKGITSDAEKQVAEHQ